MLRRNLVVLVALMFVALSCNGASSVNLPDPDGSSGDLTWGDTGAEVVPDLETKSDAGQDTLLDSLQDLDPGEVIPACNPDDGCFGNPCVDNKDCLSGWCVDHLGGSVCTDTCQEDCPSGWSCKQAGTDPDVVWVCISDFPTLCAPCAIGADCASSVVGTQAPCVEYGDEGSFCGGGCGQDDDCPAGFECKGMTVVSGGTLLQCVSETGTCSCTDKSIGLALATPCSTESEFGFCEGFRTCTEYGLSACNAGDPIAEICNGLDDECDGLVDEDTCDDGNACTNDICNGTDGCEHIALDDIECPDGDLCTVSDICKQGICVGTPMDCDDDNICTDDVCAPETGNCLYAYNALDCDDEDPCTVADECLNGGCVGVPIDCDCVVDYDCGQLEDGDLCNGTLYCDTLMNPHLCKVDLDTLIVCPDSEGPDAPCLEAACDPETGACGFAEANEEGPCNNDDLCTVTDYCENGECLGGSNVNCNDGNVCTDDSCHPDSGCVNEANTLPCSDGNACTLGDICDGGNCVGDMVIDCDDGNPCSDDSCDPDSGCVHTDNLAICSDGNACTLGDECLGGSCQPGGALNCNDDNVCTDDHCDPALGCTYSDNSQPCSDVNACTLSDVCSEGICQGGSAVDCNDGSVCTDDSCSPQLGCVNTANTAPCNDNNACTFDEACTAGVCQPGTPVDCEDGNVCTTDSCTPTEGCVNLANTAPCNDDDTCTLGDICADSVCVGGATLNCDDGNVCTDDSCDPDTGCVHENNTTTCDDQNTCTTGDVCANGTCTGAGSLDCDDANPCTKDICLPGGGCDHEDIAGSCSDGDPCTLNDSCLAGECVPGAALDCDDGNPCTDDACDQGGSCAHMNNTAACDDGNACTTGDACSNGSCGHAGLLDCDDGDVCTTGSCDPASGCVSTINTAPCDDANVCTIGDSCTDGVCVGGVLLPCDDGNTCTDDSCDEDTGCVYTPNNEACNDGNKCTDGDSCAGGICLPVSAVNCDDSETCTTDSCSPASGCVNTNNTNPCTDNDLCTTVDFCSEGVCVGSGDLTCDDGNICTDDSCAPATGCVFAANTELCNDGNSCTTGESCSAGSCSGGAPVTCDDDNQCTTNACDTDTGCTYTPVGDGTPCSQNGGTACLTGFCVGSPGGSQTFTSSGTFTTPAGVTSVRIVVVGGGGGGTGSHWGAGGSGWVRYSTCSVSGNVSVTVGSGGTGGICCTNAAPGSNGSASTFGSCLSANGGDGGYAMGSPYGVGGYGGSGGGGGGNAGCGGAGGSGGSNGASGCTYAGGVGGHFDSLASITEDILTAGAGGAPGTSSHAGGGGAGGLLINSGGPNAGNGGASWSGKGGKGYGAGGGSGGYNGARPTGGAGAAGVVYIEW